MTVKRKDEMPDEIYLVINPEMEEDEESHIIWTTDPDCYPASQIMGRYTIDTNKIAIEVKIRNEAYNAGLERGKELSSALLSPPMPDDVAEAVKYINGVKAYARDEDKKHYETLIRAASTPPVPVDTISIKKEVLQEVREALETLSRDDSNMVQDIAIKALASLDAVLNVECAHVWDHLHGYDKNNQYRCHKCGTRK